MGKVHLPADATDPTAVRMREHLSIHRHISLSLSAVYSTGVGVVPIDGSCVHFSRFNDGNFGISFVDASNGEGLGL